MNTPASTASSTPATILAKAMAAAAAAAVAQNNKLAAESSRGFDCGFAWVTIRPGRGPFVTYLKSQRIGQPRGYDRQPGYGLWYSDLHELPTQSVSVHEAAVRAFCEVLQSYGINANWNSRLD